jgi:hypothetical protein
LPVSLLALTLFTFLVCYAWINAVN